MKELEKQIDLRGKNSAHRATATDFLKQVLELGAKGYVLNPVCKTIMQQPSFLGRPRASFVTEAYAKELLNPEAVVEVELVQGTDNSEPVKSHVGDTSGEVTKEEVKEEAKPELTSTQRVQALGKKEELLALAKELDIVVPEENDKKGPKSIKQFMLNSLKAK